MNAWYLTNMNKNTTLKNKYRDLFIVFIAMLPFLLIEQTLSDYIDVILSLIWPTPYLFVILFFILIKLFIIVILSVWLIILYRQHIITSRDGILWIILLVMSIIIVTFFYDFQLIRSTGKPLWLYQFGVQTQATVFDYQVVEDKDNSFGQISYEFKIPKLGDIEENFIGVQLIPSHHYFLVGSKVEINYLPTNPLISSLKDIFVLTSDLIRPLYFNILLLVGGIYMIFVWGIIRLGVNRSKT